MVLLRLWIQRFRLVQLTLRVLSVDTKQVGVLPPTQTDAEAASSYLGSCRPFLSPIYPLPQCLRVLGLRVARRSEDLPDLGS